MGPNWTGTQHSNPHPPGTKLCQNAQTLRGTQRSKHSASTLQVCISYAHGTCVHICTAPCSLVGADQKDTSCAATMQQAVHQLAAAVGKTHVAHDATPSNAAQWRGSLTPCAALRAAAQMVERAHLQPKGRQVPGATCAVQRQRWQGSPRERLHAGIRQPCALLRSGWLSLTGHTVLRWQASPRESVFGIFAGLQHPRCVLLRSGWFSRAGHIALRPLSS
mmetsp:Transcript_47113/g.106215  ORF Transcript_47113/g.106215 Transcript_47113/m.106215 type:complete len:220 (-) Transcript_47113:746-1405(-)